MEVKPKQKGGSSVATKKLLNYLLISDYQRLSSTELVQQQKNNWIRYQNVMTESASAFLQERAMNVSILCCIVENAG